MSNARAKAEKSKAKDKRQMPIENKLRPQKSKKSKNDLPWVIEYRLNTEVSFSHSRRLRDWTKYKCYKTREIAEKVIRLNEVKNMPWEMRLRNIND